MGLLSDEQHQRALETMREYLAAPKQPDGQTPWDRQEEMDRLREQIIDEILKPMLTDYFSGTTSLDKFKIKVDSTNKQHEYWGFKGIKGQMFFNVLYNRTSGSSELDEELKAAIAAPANEEIARSRIKTFTRFVKRIGEEHVENGGSKYGRPKISSVPFFLSYFWQIQDREIWPVYYTNSVNTMTDLNLWQPTDDLGDAYVAYKHIYEELAVLFTEASGQRFGLYQVEHVFWFKGGNPVGGHKPISKDATSDLVEESVAAEPGGRVIVRLPESYVPPIVAILPRIARNEPELIEGAKASGISLPRAFEKNINAAFTILGYETKLLGYGQGRVPDGVAVEVDNSYAMLWDAKVRTEGYSMGTDDRTIREYIVTQSRELKRRRSLRNIYYVVVSSGFADDYDDAIRLLKMETDVSEVCLLEAEALVEMVDAKMRDPQQMTLGPDGLQRLLSASGVITADLVKDTLG